jgi:hypothetical protein
MPGEIEVLVLGEMLIGEDQDRVLRERILDCREVVRVDFPRQVDIADFRSEGRRDRTDGYSHGRCLLTRVSRKSGD